VTVVGAGFGETHVDLLRACDIDVGCVVYARRRERADLLARRWGVTFVTDDLAAAMTPDVDAVVVASTVDTHAVVVREALNAGKAVICDKPLAVSYPEAVILTQRIQECDLPGIVFFQWRTHPALRRLSRLIADGELGPIHDWDLAFHHDFLARPETDWPWRHQWGTAGAGALGDLGVHLVDLLHWLSGARLSTVAARGRVAVPERVSRSGGPVPAETDDVARAMFEVGDSSATASILVSRVCSGFRRIAVKVSGADGHAQVVIDPENGAARLRVAAAGRSTDMELAAANPYAVWLRTSEQSPPTFADGCAAQQVLDEVVDHVRRTAAIPVRRERA
jgi:predicted dehydrogenase